MCEKTKDLSIPSLKLPKPSHSSTPSFSTNPKSKTKVSFKVVSAENNPSKSQLQKKGLMRKLQTGIMGALIAKQSPQPMLPLRFIGAKAVALGIRLSVRIMRKRWLKVIPITLRIVQTKIDMSILKNPRIPSYLQISKLKEYFNQKKERKN